jgi:hypothetical protein
MSFRQFFYEGMAVLNDRQSKLEASPYPRVGRTSYNAVDENTWSGHDAHAHGFNLDENGNGKTDSFGNVSGKDTHYHEVRGWAVLPANNHAHGLTDKSISDKNFKNS